MQKLIPKFTRTIKRPNSQTNLANNFFIVWVWKIL